MGYRDAIEVEGLRRTVTQLKRFGARSEDLKAAFQRVGARAVLEGKAKAPKQSGALAATVKQSKRQNAVYIYAGKKAVPYAGPVHWGWPKRNITANPWLVKMAGDLEPYMREQLQRELRQLARQLGF